VGGKHLEFDREFPLKDGNYQNNGMKKRGGKHDKNEKFQQCAEVLEFREANISG